MRRLRLAAEDRARYEGCPEWLPWDPGKLSIDEAIEVQERSGIAPTEWRPALQEPSAIVWKLVVWMALNRAGLQVGWSDVKFDWEALEIAKDEAADLGKEPSSTPPPPSGPESTA